MKRSTGIILVVLFSSMLILTACSDLLPGSDPLAGTSWQLISYAGNPVLPGTTPTAAFNDGQVGGNASCNSYGGEYRVKGDTISIGTMFMTEMYCMPEEINVQEGAFLELLGLAQSFELLEDRLTIFPASGEALVFIPAAYLPD